MPHNALILGCGRSGTSIFGELFAELGPFDYFEEPLVDDVPTGSGRAIAVKVPRLPEGVAAPPGCALPDDALARTPPAPRTLFWQVRHPFDAVCSLRVGIADGWGHHPRPPDWQAWIDRPLVERCAHHWATINSSGYRQVADVAIVNHFEAMLRDPIAAARHATLAVGLDPDTVAEPIARWAHRVRDRTDSRFVEARMSRRRSRPDHTTRIDRWRENLTPEQREAIAPIVEDTARTFGYSLPNSPT